jgi:hypothetical protein
MRTAKTFLQIRFGGLALDLIKRSEFAHPSNDACGAVATGPKTSALGQKQTFCDAEAMSALPPKADICSALAHVR